MGTQLSWLGVKDLQRLDEDEVSRLKSFVKGQIFGALEVFFLMLNIAGCLQLIKVTSCGFKCQACLI